MPITAEDLITLIKAAGDTKLSVHRTTEPPEIFLTGWLNLNLLAEALNLLALNPDFDVREIVPFLKAVNSDDWTEQ
jgi:hypothetical protein